MCFSASASFSSAVVLLAVGTLTLKAARHKHELFLAAIPMLFAIQQLIEGVLWLTFSNEVALLNVGMTYLYSFFSHVLWPMYLPLSVLLMEPPGRSRLILAAFLAIGVVVGTYLLLSMAIFGITSRPVGQHIEYVAPHFFGIATMSAYLLSTTITPLLSTHRVVRLFGILAFLSFALAYYFYTTWFISVWCLFAALLSTVILAHFYWRAAAEKSVQASSRLTGAKMKAK